MEETAYNSVVKDAALSSNWYLAACALHPVASKSESDGSRV